MGDECGGVKRLRAIGGCVGPRLLSRVVNAIYHALWLHDAVGTHARMAGPEDRNGEAGLPAGISRTETLSYLSDIIHELQHLADRSGQRTLSAILSAALIEARIQKDDTRR